MNREQTIEAIKVMQAWLDGKKVEFRWNKSDWHQAGPGNLSWDWDSTEYRIAREPLEVWTFGGAHRTWGTKDRAENNALGARVFLMREVLP